MAVRHGAEGRTRTIATRVERADSWLARARGLMFRQSIPEEYALVFAFDRVRTRRLHMLCVPFPIDAVWLQEGIVERVERLDAWIGHGAARADTVIEFPAGATEEVAVGDRLLVED